MRVCRCSKCFLPLSPSVFQCLLNASNHRFAHTIGITKTHFAFCRMHIYIDSFGIELNEKERNRILSLHQSCVIAFADSSSDKVAFNRASVYEHELLAATLPAETCLTDKTTDLNFWGGSAVYFNQPLQQFDAI